MAEHEDDLGDRLARLEGIEAAEDKALERSRHGQTLLLAVVAIVVGSIVGGGVALTIYALNRIDQLELMIHQR